MNTQDNRVAWMDGAGIRPFVIHRPVTPALGANRSYDDDWFPFPIIQVDPLKQKAKPFADALLRMENLAFAQSGLAMPRWVFYDCSILPGLTAGFAIHREKAGAHILNLLGVDADLEWIPISLFICIPSLDVGEWVAHNLCTINSLLPESDRFYGLGFLSKAFGLWYADVKKLCGVTQWLNPAIKLHSFYGPFQLLTTYSPLHNIPRSLTYCLRVEPKYWASFLTKQKILDFRTEFEPMGFALDPRSEESMIHVQNLIDGGQGPFFLDSDQIREQHIEAPLMLYRQRPLR